MRITVVGIDPGTRSWGWFASAREPSWGVYEMAADWRDVREAVEEIRAWLCDWLAPAVFVVEAQPAIAHHLVTRTEATLCAVALMLKARLHRRSPTGNKRDRQDMAKAYWKLGDLKAPKTDQEHILDAAWLAMLGDER